MALLPPLSCRHADDILRWLDVPTPRHDRAWLDSLMRGYGQRVPWESASRIVRRHTRPPESQLVLPDAFWANAMAIGTGGTCFESNAAVSALLATLGFSGHMTINDMEATVACHTAIVVTLDEGPCLLDAGYPIHAAVPLTERESTVETTWFTYMATRLPDGRYLIENRPHPKPYLFHLKDSPVLPDDYLGAARADYGPSGLFLDRLVIRKIVDGRVSRFASRELPWHLATFEGGERYSEPLGESLQQAAARLAGHFAMPQAMIAQALALSAASEPPGEGRAEGPAE